MLRLAFAGWLVGLTVLCESWIARLMILAMALVWVVTARHLGRTVATLRTIAAGDRFAVFPRTWMELSYCLDVRVAAETMRRDLVEADAAIADQKRLLAESRIRREGAAFFTTRFHTSVAEAFSQFSKHGAEICETVDHLSSHNSSLLRDAESMSNAVAGTSAEVLAVSKAASQIAEVVAGTSEQIVSSDAVAQQTIAELSQTRDTINRLKDAGQEITTIVGVIQSVSSQTSLLALNATIEAARAGESGRGFAVVAAEVKTLARASEQAGGTIRRQIEAMQGAIDDTSHAIDAIMARVNALTETHRAFTTSMAHGTAAIETIGTKAGAAAARVSSAVPDLASGIGYIETAGQSVLDTARQLMSRSEGLSDCFRTYFEDLASGSIRVGILHSLSGSVTAAERPLHDLIIGLIDKTNRSGGLLGRPLEAVVVNPHAKDRAYAEGARTLLDGGAAVIFGCWTSQSRMETIPVLEQKNGLLFYPSQYEGGQATPTVVYTGGTPQQQVWPAVDFLAGLGRRRLVLVGSASTYSRGTHAAIKAYATRAGVEVVADQIVSDYDKTLRNTVARTLRMERLGQIAVISTLAGDAGVLYFREMARRGVSATRIPTLSLTIGEGEMASVDASSVYGNYVAWNYLHGVRNEENAKFVALWREICGNPAAITNDALEAAFIGFSLWRKAVEQAGTVAVDGVRKALRGMSIAAPNGFTLSVTQDQHLTLPAFVGQIQSSGAIKPVWASTGVLAPTDGTVDRRLTPPAAIDGRAA